MGKFWRPVRWTTFNMSSGGCRQTAVAPDGDTVLCGINKLPWFLDFVSSTESISRQQYMYHEELTHLWGMQTISLLHTICLPPDTLRIRNTNITFSRPCSGPMVLASRRRARASVLESRVRRPCPPTSDTVSPFHRFAVAFGYKAPSTCFPVLHRHPRCSTVPFLMPSADICLSALSHLLDIFDSCHRLLPSSSHAVCHRTCSRDVRCRCVHTVVAHDVVFGSGTF